MLTGREFILIASIDWEPLWQSHQEIATRLASAGNRVLFIENTGVRTPTARDLGRLAKRLRGWITALLRPPRQVAPHLYVVSPLVLPPFGAWWARALNRLVFLRAVARKARKLDIRDPILLTWLPTDTALDLVRLLCGRTGKVVYVCIGDFDPLAGNPDRLRRSEEELLRTVDIAFAHNDQTLAKCARFARRAQVLPPSVNLGRFPLAAVPRTVPANPRIGYVGGVHRFVDFELVAECARARPDWSWILVGPLLADPGPVSELSNVELAGPQPHEQLADWLAGFDVCTVPYVNTPDSRVVAPTKINEYLAVGRPVVATDLPWVVDFQDHHGVLEVRTNDPSDFLAGIDAALRSLVDEAAAVRRRQVAALSDWEVSLSQIAEQIEAA